MVACSRYFFRFPPVTFLSDCSRQSLGLASYLLSFLISGLFLPIKPINGFALQLVSSFCLSTSIVPFFRLERVESLALDWVVIHVFGKSASHFLLQKQSAYSFTPEFISLHSRCPLGSHPLQGSFLSMAGASWWPGFISKIRYDRSSLQLPYFSSPLIPHQLLPSNIDHLFLFHFSSRKNFRLLCSRKVAPIFIVASLSDQPFLLSDDVKLHHSGSDVKCF